MANRRIGGGMGNMQGNRSFSQRPFQGGNVNPWQGNAGGSSMNQGLINQVSANPQQLALALTSLLQNQQQNPPSLLSLKTSPAFSNQDSLRFGSRGRNDFRRHEPYNKNRPSWRQGGGRGGRDKDGKDGKKFGGKDGNKDKDKKSTEKADGEDKVTKESNGKESEEKDEKDKKFAGIPRKLLKCFVCTKSMWDSESYANHIRGRAHKQMLQSLDESFHIIVSVLRESMRLAEEKKLIEMNRQERLSKKHRRFEQESSCNMCDLKFLGKITAHRKTEGHQRLKRFLHPNCEACDKEFSSRMDWVEHRLCEAHLKKMTESLEIKDDEEEGAEEEVPEVVEDDDYDLEHLLEEAMILEDEKPVLELSEDLKDLQNRIPAYKKSRAVSSESLKPFSGFCCEICKKSFISEDLSKAHLTTLQHHQAFVEEAKKQHQKELDAAAAEEAAKEKAEKEAAEAKKKKGEENGDDMYDPEEACNEGDATMESQEGDESNVKNEEEDEEEKDQDQGGEEEQEKEEEEENTEDITMEEVPAKAPVTTPRPPRRAAAANATAITAAATSSPKAKKARK